MLHTIGKFIGKLLSVVLSAVVFVLMLPITFAAIIIMMFAGMIALINLRARFRDINNEVHWYPKSSQGTHTVGAYCKPPIEGSYTVHK